MPSSIKVSFVVPVYNMESYLRQCLDSLCQQSLADIEIICVDDGSGDRSVEILEEYEKKDPRIRIFHNKEEGPGAAMARNLGLQQVRGDYVLVVDSDDYFDLSLAEKTYDKALETGADVVIFDAYWFDNETGEHSTSNSTLKKLLLPAQKVFSSEDIPNDIFQITYGAAWNQLYRRDFLEEHQFYFQTVHVIDDIFFTSTALAMAKKIAILEEKLLYYRVNNSASQICNLDRDPLSPVKAGVLLGEWLQEKEVFALFSQSYYRCVVILLRMYLDTMKVEENLVALLHCLKKEGFSSLGLADACEKNLLEPHTKEWFEDISQNSPEEYFSMKQKRNAHQVEKGMRCGIYGVGQRLSAVFEALEAFGAVCVVLGDGSPEKQGQEINGLTVMAPEDLCPDDLDKIIISTPNYFEEMKRTLLRVGFSEEQISLI